MPRFLSDHDEIRQWVEARAGNPMLMTIPDGTGDSTSLLQFTFGQHALNADSNEGPDRATNTYELVSWDDWFAEFDRQNLAIKVRDRAPGVLDNDFEFVNRAAAETSAAAQKPAAIVTEPPDAARADRSR
jgi:hypothetical protein